MNRCINIDWLEVYAHEILDGTERDAEWFRAQGVDVQVRDYGTRQYEQMFTVLDNMGEGIIEVRRKPKGLKTETGFTVLDEGSCHLRLTNRMCYAKSPVKVMTDFCERFGFIVSRISRLDICLDFEFFDWGDEPQKFLNRYLKGRYSKINQANIRANGKDLWDGRAWNSLSWGAEKSMVTTKFYNKTLEINERKDKPYIRQAWAADGLVEDFIQLTKHDKDGNVYHPQIWRLEFSIKSGVKKWYVIEDFKTAKRKLRSIHHCLDDYQTKKQLLEHFKGLVDHYFHFKVFVDGQRKDRCPDKKLFNFLPDVDRFYEVEHVAPSKTDRTALERLRLRLMAYKLRHPGGDDARAIDAVLAIIRRDEEYKSANSPQGREELAILQNLIARRMQLGTARSLGDDLATVRALMTLSDKVF